MRFLPDDNGCFNTWRSIDNIPEVVVDSIISAEDKRFFHHPGFDPFAIARAAYINLKYGRTISGASTISQQAVRLLNPRPRTFYSKITEFVESAKLERSLSKREILELYLNLVPMGGRLKGIGIASLIYFHKDLSLINANEAACLAIIPRAPTRLDPNNMTGRESLIARAETLLRNMPHSGVIAPDSVSKTDSVFQVEFYHRHFPNDAPHFVDMILTSAPFKSPEIRTTLDLNVQRAVETILESHSGRLRRLGISQAAIMIVGTERQRSSGNDWLQEIFTRSTGLQQWLNLFSVRRFDPEAVSVCPGFIKGICGRIRNSRHFPLGTRLNKAITCRLTLTEFLTDL